MTTKTTFSGSWRTTVAVTALTLTATMALSGCGEKEDERGVAAGSGAASSTTPGVTAPAPSASLPATNAPTPDPGSLVEDDPMAELTGADCLPGAWSLDNEEFGALMSAAAGNGVSDLTGEVLVTFREDGTTSTSYDEWTYTVVVDGSKATLTKNGTDHGTYKVAADGTMSMVDTDLSSVSQMKLEVDGAPVISAVQSDPSVFGSAAFTCEGDELTVTADGATTIMHREH